MQKNETAEAVRERERERESYSLVKLGYFFGEQTKIMIEKIEGRNTFIHNGKRQTMKIKMLSHSGKF